MPTASTATMATENVMHRPRVRPTKPPHEALAEESLRAGVSPIPTDQLFETTTPGWFFEPNIILAASGFLGLVHGGVKPLPVTGSLASARRLAGALVEKSLRRTGPGGPYKRDEHRMVQKE
jgi:hypothetical protein